MLRLSTTGLLDPIAENLVEPTAERRVEPIAALRPGLGIPVLRDHEVLPGSGLVASH